MTALNTCSRCEKTFDNWHAYNDHNLNFKHTYKQMDPKKKAAIVARVESRLSPFLVGYGVREVPAVKVKPTEIVIERFSDSLMPLAAGLPEPDWGIL